ncbi:MAG TPA: GMC family oxidoreductase N-terminal domain-containing protein [Ktedonobacterales bacterium]|nr:GMC family oxidoreductase N-terminal domain-containing protein [Ktedonobacterales bacterium]
MATTQSQSTQPGGSTADTTATGEASSGVGWLTGAELRTLTAICEALIPSLPAPAGEEAASDFYARSASDLNVAQLIAETLAVESPETRAQFKQLLGLLQSPIAGALLMGRPQSFAQAPLAARESALRKMSVSSVPTLRQSFQAVKRLAAFIWYSTPVADGANPNWSAIGYTPATPPVSAQTTPKRIHPLPVTDDLTLTADAVIVGSGAGGGVMAAELTAAGKDVVILEKGGYFSESDFNGSEAAMTPQLYLRRGTLATSDLGMVVLAGSCLGGGTVVNWSTSLRTPPDVLAEWERDHGVTGATGADYQKGFDFAEQRLGVNTDDSARNPNNAALERGCEALGYRWSVIPRNASGCEQRCGACGYGCPYGRKQSTLITFVQDAHERGARVVVRCQVERVLMEQGRAVGVEGWAPDDNAPDKRRKVIVRAPVVVVAAGSVESPALLLRSGLTNPNIGRHLRLHPVAAIAAYYADPIETWKGSLQTALSDQFKDLKGGYGLRFEVAPAHPGLLGLTTPWQSGLQHKQDMRRIANVATFIALTRDTGAGQVTLDHQGDPILRYYPNETDRKRLMRGMGEMARIAVAGGATRVALLHSQRLVLDSEGGQPGAVSAARLQAFIGEIERRGIAPNRLPLFSAHQMGTCRLGADPKTSVANPDGQVHGVAGLYIADASGFPTASGVNPMLSTMALAYHVAQRAKA